MERCASGDLLVRWHAVHPEAETVASDSTEQFAHRRRSESRVIARGTKQHRIAKFPLRDPEGIECRRLEKMKIGDLTAAGQVGERNHIIAQNAARAIPPTTAPVLDFLRAHTANIIH